MSLEKLKPYINPILVGSLILFSLPIKLPSIQQSLESFLSISFPIKLSLYTFLLPPVALFSIIWNRKRTFEIFKILRLPLIVLALLFFWMWFGSIMSHYPEIALKHSARYSIYLLTFLGFLYAIEKDSFNNTYIIFSGIYILLMTLTFLDFHGGINIPRFLSEYGLHIDLFYRENRASSFFENPNPYSVASVGVFFWFINRLQQSWFISSLGIMCALYSVLISHSRNGYFTLFLSIILFLILAMRKFRKTKEVIILVLGIAVTIVISTYFIYSLTKEKIVQRGIATDSFEEMYEDWKITELRFIIYRAAIEVGLKNLDIIGSGTKTFGNKIFENSKSIHDNWEIILVHRLGEKWKKIAYNAHNAILTIWIEMGFFGLFFVLIFLFLWFAPALRSPPLFMMPMLAFCVGQILDYFVWEILFMAFQSFFFAHFANRIYFFKEKSND